MAENIQRPLSAEVAKHSLTQVSKKKGEPFRKAKERARLLLADFDESEMRQVLERVINANPEVVCGILCEIWEEQIETAKSAKHLAESNPDCRCRTHRNHVQGTLF